ncbi:MAG: hypothetical protein AB8G15_06970 [Saprospiraceae bacterium]
MKVLKFLFITLIFFNFLACQSQREEILLETPSASANATEVNLRMLSEEEIKFEKGMQWTAFIAAKVLHNYPATRFEVISLIDAQEQTINLDDLLGPSSLAPNFKTHFSEMLLPFFGIPGKPSEEEDTPPRPILRGQSKNGPISDSLKLNGKVRLNYNSEALAEFLSFILDENCILLFFPNGLDFNYGFTLTSTAHPLTIAQKNRGILRLGPHEILLEGQKESIDVTVNEFYVDEGTNIIVARPTRDLLHTHCYYPSLNFIHFPLFLNE